MRIRSPSGTAVGSTRGVAPTEITSVSASMRSKSVPPFAVATMMAFEPSSRPSPCTRFTPASMRFERMSSDCCAARPSSRLFTAARLIATLGFTALSDWPFA